MEVTILNHFLFKWGFHMPDFKFNEPHFCWTVIISITWNQTNHRNPVCDSPTPWDGKRHLEWNLGWILRERDTWSEIWAIFRGIFLAEVLPGCPDPAFRSRRQTAGIGSFWKLFSVSWPEKNHSEAFRAQLFMLWKALSGCWHFGFGNFPAVWGHGSGSHY